MAGVLVESLPLTGENEDKREEPGAVAAGDAGIGGDRHRDGR